MASFTANLVKTKFASEVLADPLRRSLMRPNYSAFTSLDALINWKLVQSTKKKAEKNRIFVSFFLQCLPYTNWAIFGSDKL